MRNLLLLFVLFPNLVLAESDFNDRPNKCYCQKMMVSNFWIKQVLYKEYSDTEHYVLKVEFFPPNTNSLVIDTRCMDDLSILNTLKVCQN